MKNNNRPWITGAVCTAVLAAAPVVAQESGGRLGSLSFSQTIRSNDNANFDASNTQALTARTDLGFSISTETRVDQLSLSVGTALDFDLTNDEGLTVQSPTFNLSYRQTSKTAAFTASARYVEVDINTLTELNQDEDTGEVFVTAGTGTRANAAANLGLEFGLGAPVGGSLGYSYASTDYRDTVDPDLLDRTNQSFNGNFRFAVTRTVDLTAGATYSSATEDGAGTDQNRLSYRVGANGTVRPGVNAGASIGYSFVETIDNSTATPVTTETEGLTASANVSAELPNGSISGRVSTNLDSGGRTTSANINRSINLPTGNLQLTFGLAETEDGGLNPLYGVSYAHEMKSGQIGVNLNQRFVSQADGDQAVNSLLSVSYGQELTPLIGINASVSFADTSAISGDVDDGQRLEATLSVSQSLTEDWRLVGGYTFTQAKDEADETTSSNTVFVGISRDFDWRW